MNKLAFVQKINGKPENCEAICTYEDNNKNYIIYTDKKTTMGKLNLYYALYEFDNKGNIIIIPIKDLKDKKIALSIIEELLKTLKGEIK